MFFVQHLQQKKCECGKREDVTEFDRNLFAETIITFELLKRIDAAISEEHEIQKKQPQVSSAKSKVIELQAIKDKFFSFVSFIMETSSSTCIRDRDGSVPKDVTNNPNKHRTMYINWLEKS